MHEWIVLDDLAILHSDFGINAAQTVVNQRGHGMARPEYFPPRCIMLIFARLLPNEVLLVEGLHSCYLSVTWVVYDFRRKSWAAVTTASISAGPMVVTSSASVARRRWMRNSTFPAGPRSGDAIRPTAARPSD